MGGENGDSHGTISYGVARTPHSTTKTNDEKAHFSKKLVSSGISDVVIASVYSEKPV